MKNLKTPGKTGRVGRYDPSVYTSVVLFTISDFEMFIQPCQDYRNMSSHNFKLQNYRGKYLLNLNNYGYIGICLHVISRIRLSSL